MRSTRTHTECLTLLGLAHPDNAALLNTVALLEAYNLVLVVHELLVLLEIGRAMPHLIQPCLVAQNEPLVAVCHVLGMEALDVIQIIGDICWQHLERRKVMLVKQVLNPGITLLVCAVLDSVIDVEINLLHLLVITRLERLALHNADNLLKRQAVAVKLAVKNSALGEAVNLGADVVQVRERLASAREESLVADCEAADAVQLPLSIAGELDILATLVVVMRQHRVRDRTSVHRLLGVLCRRWLGRLC